MSVTVSRALPRSGVTRHDRPLSTGPADAVAVSRRCSCRLRRWSDNCGANRLPPTCAAGSLDNRRFGVPKPTIVDGKSWRAPSVPTGGGAINAPPRWAADESVCTPGPVPTMPWHGRRRPSISACRRRQALAAYPQTRAGSPQASAQATASRQVALLALLRVGFTEPSRSPGMLVGSYPTVSPLPPRLAPRRRSAFCGTVPRVTPGCR